MKFKYILIGLLGGSTLLSSCNKWLEVMPKTEIPQEELFSTEQGFKDAMSGVYIQMKSSDIYGKNLTMTVPEHFLTNWDVTSSSLEYKLGYFNFEDATVQSTMNAIYKGEYTVISSINAILANIEKQKSVFKTPGLYELIKAECLALRAYCHFDVLRMWGPVPSNVTDKGILPYVKELSNKPNVLLSFNAFQNNVLQDLKEAEELLKDVDPVLNYSLVDLGNPGGETSAFKPSDTYFAYRYLNMNYYAVKALQSRAYLWFNKLPEANAAAKVVIDAKNPNGDKKFRLGTSSDFNAKNFVLTPEQIFGLYDFQLSTKYTSLFSSGTLKKSTSASTVTSQLYGSTGTDIREAQLWSLVTLSNSSLAYVCQKYNVPATPATGFADLNRIPMIRLSELYFIAIETATSGAEAQTYWSEFRRARNIQVTDISSSSADQIKAALRSEYRKEFIAEGQAFYAYKRWNSAKADVLWVPSASTINYVVPLPLTESSTTN